MDVINDIRDPYRAAMAKEKDEEKKAAKLRELMTETIPQTMVVVLLYIVLSIYFHHHRLS